MKTLLKVLAGLVLVVVILVVAGGAILSALFDPNEYKPEIEQLALEQAGIELKINGDIGWSVFPWLGLEVNQIDARYPDKAPLASLQQAKLAVRLPALLGGRVEMQSLVVDGLQLSLVQDKSGNNWSLPAAQPAAAAKPDSAAEAAGGAALQLDIESIAISNGQLSYDDRLSGTRLELTDLNLATGQVVTNAFFPAELSFKARQFQAGQNQPAASVDAKLQAEFYLDLAKQQYRAKGLDSTLQLTAAALGEQTLPLKLAADIDSDLNKQSAQLNNLKLSLANLNASGELAVQDFVKPKLSGSLVLAPFDLQALLATLGQPKIETSDPNVLKKVSLAAQLDGPANTLTAKQLTLKLDDTTFNGDAAYDLANGAIRLNLAGDSLDADRYLPPQKDAKQVAPAADSGSAGGERYSKEPVIPVEPLKALNLDSTFKLAALKLNKLDISNVDLAISAHNGLVNARRLNADLYGGTVRNQLTLDTRMQPIKLHTVKKVSNIQIGDLLKSAANVDKLTGSFSSQADITSRGRSVHDIVHSMTGNAAVQMKDGEIRGIDMAQTICQGMNTVGSLGINTPQVDRSTPFANLNATTRITNGVINNPDLKASLDAMTLNGRGAVDLPQALLDYRLGLVIEENLFKKTCRIPGKIEGVEWPVNCKGSFDTEPAKLCKPDLSVFKELMTAEVKAKAKEKIEEKKEELEQKLGDKLGDKLGEKLGGEEGAKKLLKGLFGD
ncbi:AsmA family protein [Marinobacterium arenosum]|uniref:AsmA family protein n=1 Tax=Marinobacterium arenosum TaxID=2862496 RepID=UPI001C93E99C|nr:AsmA family protein [Marinobacterium arenosum]MBY4677515.1 AsmA family protein [Marinobacterium arenosum]